jgi:[acyl-carrier-protein] S-malonyltransferase
MIAAVFPGQGSQKPGMGASLLDSSPAARAVFEEVSATLGKNIADLCQNSDEDTLRLTQNAQIALFTCGVATYHAAAEQGFKANVFAGHSIGEYAALVAAGILSLADGAKLVQRRGELMSTAGKGTMAAVLGLEIDAIQAVLATVDGVVVVANDNCPGQVVISGEVAAVESAGPKLTEAGAKRVLPLNVSGAFHSPLMQAASVDFVSSLAAAQFVSGATVYSNVTTKPVTDPSQWAGLLEQQLRDSVRWTPSVQNMIADGVTQVIEFGVGEVLCGMMKRIDKTVTARAVQDADSLAALIQG